jgi:hypothetical protein
LRYFKINTLYGKLTNNRIRWDDGVENPKAGFEHQSKRGRETKMKMATDQERCHTEERKKLSSSNSRGKTVTDGKAAWLLHDPHKV